MNTLNKVMGTEPYMDVMQGCLSWEIKIHEHGFLRLVDVMPRLVPPQWKSVDFAIVQAARVSYGSGLKSLEEDTGLIRYLMRHRHMTPFEMVELKFDVSLPIFVARQWIRHRTANVNEVSARYTELSDNYWLPGVWRRQGTSNKQGGEEPMEYMPGKYRACSDQSHCDNEDVIDVLIEEGNGSSSKDIHDAADTLIRLRDANPRVSAEDIAIAEYHDRIKAGVSREMARSCLPVSIYTQWYWKCDLRNLLGFLSLRCDSHAQAEIRDYANAMRAILDRLAPVTMEAWRDYDFEAVRLSRLEVERLRSEITALKTGIARPTNPLCSNGRESAEWEQRSQQLGL